MTSLEILDLQGNDLSSVPADALTSCNLRVLNLRGNRLRRAPHLAGGRVLELLLDGNRLETLDTLPDDVGAESWGSLRRLGLSNNGVASWPTLRSLAAFEHLEAVDLRRNPFHAALDFAVRPLLAWLCPLLRRVDDAPVTDDEQSSAAALFSDGAGGVGESVLLLDEPADTGRLHAFLRAAVPDGNVSVAPTVAPAAAAAQSAAAVAAPAGLTPAQAEQFATVRGKVKEMSQIVKVLHRAHVNERRRAATRIQSWFRGELARLRRIPLAARMRYARFSVYGGGRAAAAAAAHDARHQSEAPVEGGHITSVSYYAIRRTLAERSKLVESVVAQSREDERRMRASFKWPDNPHRLHVSRCRRAATSTFEGRAAQVIQSAARGFLVRSRVHHIRHRHVAALSVQCAWRDFLARRERRERPAEFRRGESLRRLEQDTADLRGQNSLLQNALKVLWNESRAAQVFVARLRTRAATKLQARVRGAQARAVYAEMVLAHTAYRVARGIPSVREERHRAALTLQAVWRGVRGRRRADEAREKAAQRREIADLRGQVATLFSLVRDLQATVAAASPPPPSQQQEQRQEEEEEERQRQEQDRAHQQQMHRQQQQRQRQQEIQRELQEQAEEDRRRAAQADEAAASAARLEAQLQEERLRAEQARRARLEQAVRERMERERAAAEEAAAAQAQAQVEAEARHAAVAAAAAAAPSPHRVPEFVEQEDEEEGEEEEGWRQREVPEYGYDDAAAVVMPQSQPQHQPQPQHRTRGMHFIGSSIGGSSRANTSGEGVSGVASAVASLGSARTAIRSQMPTQWSTSSDLLPLSQRGHTQPHHADPRAALFGDAAEAAATELPGGGYHVRLRGGAGPSVDGGVHASHGSTAVDEEEVDGDEGYLMSDGLDGFNNEGIGLHYEEEGGGGRFHDGGVGGGGVADEGYPEDGDDDDEAEYAPHDYRFNDMIPPPRRAPPSPPVESLL